MKQGSEGQILLNIKHILNYMPTSSGQGRQLCNGFANRVQRQKAISDKANGF